MKSTFAVPAAALAALLLGSAGAQEEAPQAPWSLQFSHGPLQLITVHYRDGSYASAYYMVFTLRNPGPTDAPLSLQVKAIVGSNPRKQQTLLALPHADAEEQVRRITRADDLKNVQDLNAGGKGVLRAGESVRGIAVFGAFHREWDVAVVRVSGLEPRSIRTRVRQYGDGFTVVHRAWTERNERIRQTAGADAQWREFPAIVFHDVQWEMRFLREGDEYGPARDPIYLEREGWIVAEDPAPRVEREIKVPFGK
jgi:hypothetical protein